jgi:hypothetical protein
VEELGVAFGVGEEVVEVLEILGKREWGEDLAELEAVDVGGVHLQLELGEQGGQEFVIASGELGGIGDGIIVKDVLQQGEDVFAEMEWLVEGFEIWDIELLVDVDELLGEEGEHGVEEAGFGAGGEGGDFFPDGPHGAVGVDVVEFGEEVVADPVAGLAVGEVGVMFTGVDVAAALKFDDPGGGGLGVDLAVEALADGLITEELEGLLGPVHFILWGVDFVVFRNGAEVVNEVVEVGPTVNLCLLLGEEILVEVLDVVGVVGFECGEGFGFCEEAAKIMFQFR